MLSRALLGTVLSLLLLALGFYLQIFFGIGRDNSFIVQGGQGLLVFGAIGGAIALGMNRPQAAVLCYGTGLMALCLLLYRATVGHP